MEGKKNSRAEKFATFKTEASKKLILRKKEKFSKNVLMIRRQRNLYKTM